MAVRVILCVFSCYFLGDDGDADDSDSFRIQIALVASFCPENPASKFLQSCVQFRKPIETVQTAVHQRRRGRVGGSYNSGVLGAWLRWGDEWKNPNCVFIWGVGGHFWEDEGVGRLLWKIKDILSNVLRATKYSVLGEKQVQNRAKNTKKKLLKISPPRTAVSPRNPTLNLSEMHCLHVTVRILHFVRAISNRSSWERTMVAGAAKRVPQKQFMYNKHSHRKSKKSAPRIIPERKFQKQHSAPRRGRKGTVPPSLASPSRPLKALQIGLSEALFQPSLHLSINAADRSVPFSKTTKKKGKVKVWFFFFFFKKCHFHHFFSSSSTSSFLLDPI